ncbi:hypothetical protein CERZMDRAFT_97377 [Cercospora zeae-maydis SCOH1-5]|uniref:Uncharacterized protein n=1 Tax=Cercospora zeae-maydis SCOH1-5 TaxID=717836 RepID=A0A6A6FHI2_9PEZI|nr:hypothetical protein CERZMDRAFT_97377 [Cercospora zeae-maydis SCOH1-5]
MSLEERRKIAAEAYVSPISAHDRQVEQELNDSSSRPIEVLQRCIQSGLASPHVLYVCLAAQFRDQARYPRRRRGAILESQREDQLARTALAYILQDPGKWASVLHKNTELVDHLCFFAVLEGLQDFMLRFLKIEPNPDNPFWRPKMFVGLIRAVDLLDTTNCADENLKLFFSMLGTQEVERSRYDIEANQHVPTEMPALLQHRFMSPAAVRMAVILGRPQHPLLHFLTDTKLYDRFIQYCEIQKHKSRIWTEEEVSWTIAELQLHHPAGCNEAPALKLLEGYAIEGYDAFRRDANEDGSSYKIAQSVANFVKRTACVAEANSNMAAARWVFNTFEEDFFRAKHPSLEPIEGFLAHYGPRLTHVQRQLLNVTMRSNGAARKLLSEKVVGAPTVQVKLDPKAHANTFQNMFRAEDKKAEPAEPQKRPFGL